MQRERMPAGGKQRPVSSNRRRHSAVQTERARCSVSMLSTRASSSAGLDSNSDAARIVWRTSEVSAAASMPFPVTSPMISIQPSSSSQTS